MNKFKFSKDIDKNKMFLVNWSELEGRLDPYFYQPEFVKIDKKIKRLTSVKLKDLIVSIASGATPKKIESQEYYSNEEHGVPFLRVQNITENGINFDNLVYITKKTHESYLKRSQFYENDLLITITGRIASCAVVPKGFSGNINQHSVVVKTANRNISEYLAVFLNSNVGNKLALRRTTGGTRPALDYEALKDIPVVEALPIVEVMQCAYKAKQTKEAEAHKLLDGIDGYLLGELGIKQPAQAGNSIEDRIFIRNFQDISGNRFDPKAYEDKVFSLKLAIDKSEHRKVTFRKLITSNIAGDWGYDTDTARDFYSKCLVIRSTEFDNSFNLNLENRPLKRRLISDAKLLKMDIQENDILIEKSGGGPKQPVGRVAILTGDVLNSSMAIGYSNFIQKIRVDESVVLPIFLFYYLKTIQRIGLTDSMQSQTNGIKNLISNEYFAQKIPIPPQSKQRKIIKHIDSVLKQAKKLQQQAGLVLENAKKQVEEMILNKK